MGHRAVFTAASPAVYAAMGETAIFTPATGAPIACHVFLDFREELDPTGMETQVSRNVPTIDALISEIGRAPVAGETFTFAGGIVYTVQAVIENDGISCVAVAI